MSGKLEMATTELASAKVDLNHMNLGSKKLDEILGAQIVSGNKHGLGFDCGAFTSKNICKFIQGKTLFAIDPTVYQHQPTHVNSAPKKYVHYRENIPICRFWWNHWAY